MVVLDTLVPVFAIVALGYGLAARRPLDGATLAELALVVTSPALLFTVLAESELDLARFGALVGGTLFVVGGTALLAVLYARSAGVDPRGVLLPATLWNAGNMALPVAQLAFGAPGLEAAAIVLVLLVLLQSSVGVWIAKGAGGFAEALRGPLLWAALAGALASACGLALPRMLAEPVRMLGAMAIPVMLLHLGAQLRALPLRAPAPALAAVAIRLGGGLAFALLFARAAGLEGTTRAVLLLEAVMPPAVINVVIAQRYGASPDVVAASVALGTVASAGAIAALLAVLG